MNLRWHFEGYPVITRIIVINIAVFLAANLYVNFSPAAELLNYAGLSSSLPYVLYHPWTLFTYMFLHTGVMHILFNMLWLYWMGKLFVEYLGEKKFMYTYILGGIAGGLFYLAADYVTGAPPSILMGASAGIMAVMVAIAVLLPDYPIFLFLIGEVKLKWVVLGAFLLFSIVDIRSNSGGKISHIGGAIYGWLYIWQSRKGNDFANILSSFFHRFAQLFSGNKARPVKTKATGGKSKAGSVQRRIDDILDKISRSGYESLSREEKDFLFKSGRQ
ncbi:MAG: rhomboid family intramembrane serine protease [Bacteroidia bacterium]|nr:rhomboid family intramembrane serine protease [Bacteroidia bacterium]